MKGEVNRTLEILEGAKDENGCIPMTLVRQALKKLEQGWIPCSERLPEEDACYLVTTSGTNNDIIDIAYYTEGIWHKASRIKAWMPLPEKYHDPL